MSARPRMRLITANAFTGLRISSESFYMGVGEWSIHPVCTSILSPGLRGGSGTQALRGFPAQTVLWDSGLYWNSFGLHMDMRLTAAIGSTENILIWRVSGSDAWYLRRTSTGKVRFEIDGGASWTSSATLPSNVVKKLEVLVYKNTSSSVPNGYFKVLIEGVTYLEVYNVDLFKFGSPIGLVTLANANLDIGEPAIYAGIGGWTEADVRSDTAGNPRVLPIQVNGQGHYSDGTPSTGFGTNASHVDDGISNTTDWVQILAADAEFLDSYTLENLPGTVSRVIGAVGYFYTRNTSGGQQQPKMFLRMNPEATVGYDAFFRTPWITGYSAPTSFTGYTVAVWQNDPSTGRPFTPAAINAMELGWGPQESGATQVSHAYAEVVCYDSPPAAAAIPQAPKMLVRRAVHRWARLWRLEPNWGSPLFFTDADTPLTFSDGITYQPVGAVSTSDRRRELGLKDSDADFRGAITSDLITVADLRCGRYDGARLVEYLVDFKRPWVGSIKRSEHSLRIDELDGETFLARIEGMLAPLEERAGDLYYPRCRADVFDDDYPVSPTRPSVERVCKLRSLNYHVQGIVGVVTDRRVFQITDLHYTGTAVDTWFPGGMITWMTGANANISGVIKSANPTGPVFSLMLPMPFDVAQFDTVMLWPGCNKLIGTVNSGDCEDKFDNVRNYGGFLLIPGTDAASRGTND